MPFSRYGQRQENTVGMILSNLSILHIQKSLANRFRWEAPRTVEEGQEVAACGFR
jgi:hypothetical protein